MLSHLFLFGKRRPSWSTAPIEIRSRLHLHAARSYGAVCADLRWRSWNKLACRAHAEFSCVPRNIPREILGLIESNFNISVGMKHDFVQLVPLRMTSRLGRGYDPAF